MKDQFGSRAQRLSLDLCRHFYAEEIRVTGGIHSEPLVEALERVPRERFVGPPPWHLLPGFSLWGVRHRTTTEVRDLYHDVLVTLKEECAINNGQPSLLAKLIDSLRLAPGKRVVHIGCGTGYYTAIMAELVGTEGSVVAIDIDPEMAARAAENLGHYDQVKVLSCDGASIDPGPSDAILVNAGFAQPHPDWLRALKEGGVLVMPLLVGRTPQSGDAMAFAMERNGEQFKAEALTLLTIYASPTLRDPAIQSLIHTSFESHDILRTHSLRLDTHAADETCVAHTANFCLSSKHVPEDGLGAATS